MAHFINLSWEEVGLSEMPVWRDLDEEGEWSICEILSQHPATETLRRGDVVFITDGPNDLRYRNEGRFFCDGFRMIPQHTSYDEYGAPPSVFLWPTEFSKDHFCHVEKHNQIVWFDRDRFRPQILSYLSSMQHTQTTQNTDGGSMVTQSTSDQADPEVLADPADQEAAEILDHMHMESIRVPFVHKGETFYLVFVADGENELAVEQLRELISRPGCLPVERINEEDEHNTCFFSMELFDREEF
jgi:hypothetical protein